MVIDNVIVKLPDKFNYDKRISDVYYSMSRRIIDVILDDSRKSDKEISEKIDKYFGYIEKYNGPGNLSTQKKKNKLTIKTKVINENFNNLLFL